MRQRAYSEGNEVRKMKKEGKESCNKKCSKLLVEKEGYPFITYEV